MGHDIVSDAEVNEMIQILNVGSVFIHKDAFEPFTSPLSPSHNPYIKENPKL